MASDQASVDYPASCNVVWTSPSQDSSGSMPLGNGELGANVWMETNGDLVLLLARGDAWDENGRLVKLGRVRVRFDPTPDVDAEFRQELDLTTGTVRINSRVAGEPFSLAVWADAERPLLRIECAGAATMRLEPSLELWRMAPRVLEAKRELHGAYGLSHSPQPVIIDTDTVLRDRPGDILWCHRNQRSIWPTTLAVQSLELPVEQDPLLHRTFGAWLRKEGTGARQSITVYTHTAQTKSLEAWQEQLEQAAARMDAVPEEKARAEHERWWRQFWARSRIVARGGADSERVTRGYALQRFITACAGRGAYPVKFNGSLFTVDAREPGEVFDADYRRWGGPYWFQNTRLVYWPLLMTGDADEMSEPWLRMFHAALPLAEQRTERYFGFAGACFPETMYFWGTYANDNYGWNRTGKPLAQVDNAYIRHHWSGMLELIFFMCEKYAFSGDEQFVQETLVPLARPIITFFDRRYPDTDAEGNRFFSPSQAVETWQDADNPADLVGGLAAVLPALLRLPGITEKDRLQWSKLLDELPPLATETADEKTWLLPARRFERHANSENPELYPVFPFRLYGIGRDDLEIGRETFARRRHRGFGGWRQDAIQAALLGLADHAKAGVVHHFSHPHPGSRFAAFWGPNADWIPDQDHGNVAMIALQYMLLQADDEGGLLLLPAWPEEWDVEFKLHAPDETVVEFEFRNGKPEKLIVTVKGRIATMWPDSNNSKKPFTGLPPYQIDGSGESAARNR